MAIIRHTLLSLVLLFISASGLMAQSDVRQQINAIKMDQSYIKAEANDTTESAAIDMAAFDLIYNYNANRQEQGLDSISIEVLRPALQSLVYARGSIKRVLVFIEVAVADSLQQAYSDTVSTVQPVVVPLPEATPRLTVAQPDLGDLILLLSQIEMADEAVKLILQNKQEGKIADSGQLHSVADIPADAHLLIYDRDHAVRAILAPTQTGYLNVKRNCPDSISNYSGCGALWFK